MQQKKKGGGIIPDLSRRHLEGISKARKRLAEAWGEDICRVESCICLSIYMDAGLS